MTLPGLILTGLLLVPPGAAADYVPHRVVVRFFPRADGADRAQLRRRLEVLTARGLRGDDTVVYRVAEDVSVPEALGRARASEEVEFAEPDFLYRGGMVPDDPEFGNQWGLRDEGWLCTGFICWTGGEKENDIGAVRAWDVSTGSASTIIGVVDSGITYGHEDLASQIATNPGEMGDGRESNGVDDDADGYVDNWRGWDVSEADNDATDTEGHGTKMSGIAASAPDNGLGMIGSAWEARILPVRTSNTDRFSSANIAAAIRYAASHGASVINISLYGPRSTAVEEAIASFPNVLFVACAGNDSSSAPAYPCGLDLPNLLCVAATDREDRLASFSNYGPHVDIAAPGVQVTGTTMAGGYAYGEGTSQATAMTSGAAALVRSFLPARTATQIRQRIIETVDPVPALSDSVASGGRLDVGNALDFVAPDTTIDPPVPAVIEEPTLDFGFNSDESGSRFECRLDAGTWTACASGEEVGPLGEGPHEVAVRAIDRGKNVDGSPAAATFVVDAALPVTTITAGPEALSNSATATFGFTASEPSTFECRLDQGEWSHCDTIGKIYGGLGEGQHTFSVRATDGRGHLEESPPVYAWTVDLSAPETAIESGPPPLSRSPEATFAYSSEPGAAFECRLDGATFAPCADSGTTYSGLDHGDHAFAVRASDAAGNVDQSPAILDFGVDLIGPAVQIESAPPPESESTTASFTYTSAEPGVSFQCSLDGEAFAGCDAGGITYKGLSLGIHGFALRGLDAVGNVGPAPPSYSFAVKAPSLKRKAIPPPATVMRKKPPRRSARRTVVFVLGGGRRYSYRLDRHPWRSTVRQLLILRVRPGRHLLSVIAIDHRGADPTPLRYRFWTHA